MLLPEFTIPPAPPREESAFLIRTAHDDLCDRAWDEVPRNSETYSPAIRQICEQHRLPSEPIHLYESGTQIVFSVGKEFVIKLYCPLFGEDIAIESLVLHTIHSQLPVPTPTIAARGEIEGWPYLVMTQLRGQSLGTVWPLLGVDNRKQLINQIANVTATLHSLPLTPPFQRFTADWNTEVENKRRQVSSRQAQLGLDNHWVDQVDRFLDSNLREARMPFQPVLLHTELTDDVWLTSESSNGVWELTGLFDFGDAFVGHREYDFAAIGLFVTRGEREMFREFLLRYGYSDNELTESLSARILCNLLLHRYCNLRSFFAICPPPSSVRSLEQLASFWFGC